MFRENMILFGASSPNLLSISDDHLVGKLTYWQRIIPSHSDKIFPLIKHSIFQYFIS